MRAVLFPPHRGQAILALRSIFPSLAFGRPVAQRGRPVRQDWRPGGCTDGRLQSQFKCASKILPPLRPAVRPQAGRGKRLLHLLSGRGCANP